MKFEEALSSLRHPNKAIRRKDDDWRERYGFLYIPSLPHGYYCSMVLETKTPYVYDFINNLDWESDDWEVIDMIEQVSEGENV